MWNQGDDMDGTATKQMKLRYAGTCRLCEVGVPARAEAIYEPSTRTVLCLVCAESASATDSDTTPIDAPLTVSGPAGGSARREYERRKATREERVRTRHPKIGGLLLALSDEPQTTRAWEKGAVGEELLGARLDGLAGHDVAVLHDRRIPGSLANIDHIVVTRSRVWVIDAKRYKGRPELQIEGGLFRPRVERLRVNRRDQTKLVEGSLKQVGIVQNIIGTTPVTGALCFVEADWPLIGGSFVTQGVHVLWPRRLAKLITEDAGSGVDVANVAGLLADVLKPA